MPDQAELFGSQSLPFVEELYARYLREPASVDPEWRAYFDRAAAASNGSTPPGDAASNGADAFAARPQLGPSRRQGSLFHAAGGVRSNGIPGALPKRAANGDVADLQDRVDQFVRAFRVRGHLLADLDPLGLPRPEQPELEMAYYGLTDADLDRTFSSRTIYGTQSQTLREILSRLSNTYCRSIGVQFMHIDDLHVKNWLTERMESTENRLQLSRTEQTRILTHLTDAVIFEEFLQKKYLGAKRFSLEGGESLIPLLHMAIEEAARHGAREVVLGMAHRGRINVLANILEKPPAEIFFEFEDTNPEEQLGRGDVKYHLGYSNDYTTSSGEKVHLSLCFNPSHLEFVNPVGAGRVRAKQDRYDDTERRGCLSFLIHGDAAFIGQGVTQETFNLSQLEGYSSGGSLHIVVNNQVGFTTSPESGRSSTYATDVAKMLQVPIFHVNGEDPEAVMQVVRLALAFRHEFQRDVVIDMYCYRRYGHNEGDEPEFTQPLMYRAIKQRKSVRRNYLKRLLDLNDITAEEADGIAAERRAVLEKHLDEARTEDFAKTPNTLGGVWQGIRGGKETSVPRVQAKLSAERVAELLQAAVQLPEGFTPHSKIKRLLGQRAEMATGARPLDWAAGESLAFADLLTAGKPVRMTGQDCQRGTFSHRHAVLHDYENGETWSPLANLAPDQAKLEIHNSPLSEVAVMAFEYGYSLDTPQGLTIWEAQFGDFVNCAQMIIDQFIVSAEAKWNRLSGLVLLLPHGFEGQGPEHSSARLERFLSMAAEDNIQVVNPTTPAQYCNLLRRQVLRPWRKPLIVMTPKSLLRHPRCVSTIDDLLEGHFHRVLPDAGTVNGQPDGESIDPRAVRRILLCSGKIYYDLLARRERDGRRDVAILRLEQLYPLAADDLRHALSPYPADVALTWVQEEPRNMGAWPFLHTQAILNSAVLGPRRLYGITRRASATPASGSSAAHKLEQEQLIEQAFSDN